MNAHLNLQDRPQPYAQPSRIPDLSHVPQDVLAEFLRQHAPPSRALAVVQPDLEERAELMDLRAAQKKQEELNEEFKRMLQRLEGRRSHSGDEANSSDEGSSGQQRGQRSSKKRKRTKRKSKFLLNVKLEELDDDQIETRTELMKLVSGEMSRLTGIKKDGQIENADENEDSESEQPARQVMTIDFSQKVDAAVNMKLIDRVSALVYNEQKDPKTSSLEHKNVEFTLADLRDFTKERFRTMRRANIERTNSGPRNKRKTQNRKNKLKQRQRYLKAERTKAVVTYKEKNGVDPSPLLEYSDCMTEEMSELDTDTEQKKTEHGRKMAERAGLTLEEVEQGLPVWEVVRPAHRSTEAAGVYDELDSIRRQQRKEGKSRRTSTKRVNFGRLSIKPPPCPIYPFMLNTEWFTDFKKQNPDEVVKVKKRNPEGFDAADDRF